MKIQKLKDQGFSVSHVLIVETSIKLPPSLRHFSRYWGQELVSQTHRDYLLQFLSLSLFFLDGEITVRVVII